MDTKLTLKLQQTVIERAKEYAKSQNTSFSKLIENYLNMVMQGKEGDKEKITPLVKSLSGIINLPRDYNHKKDYADFLTGKYK